MSLSRILADVTIVQPVASVLLEVPGATGDVLITSAVATTSVQIPIADISYFNIVVAAEVDYRGLNPLVKEFKVVLDTARLGVYKNLFDNNATTDSQTTLFFKKGPSDVAQTSELKTFSLQRSISESVHSQDDFNAAVPTDDGEVMAFGKHVPDDAVTKSDIEQMSFGKKLTESETTSETRTVALSKAKADTVANADSTIVGFAKTLADAVDAGDEMNAVALTDDGEVMVFGKTLPDGFTQSDEAFVTAEKVASDSATSSDQLLPFELGKGITDVPVTSETQLFDISKPLDDAPITWDYKAVVAAKAVSDKVYYPSDGPNQYNTYAPTYFSVDYVFEGFPAITFAKSLNDTVYSTDDFYGTANSDDDETMSFAKVLTDLAGSSDNQIRFTSKLLTDSVGKSDVSTASTGKSLTDSVSKSDALTDLFGKSLADSKSTSDAKTQLFGKLLTDTPITSESKAFAISKSLNDTVISTDDFYGAANSDDDETMAFTKALSDSFNKSDSVVTTAGKGVADSISKSDSGSLVWTDYWDINYTVTTSGVYVGNSRTF